MTHVAPPGLIRYPSCGCARASLAAAGLCCASPGIVLQTRYMKPHFMGALFVLAARFDPFSPPLLAAPFGQAYGNPPVEVYRRRTPT